MHAHMEQSVMIQIDEIRKLEFCEVITSNLLRFDDILQSQLCLPVLRRSLKIQRSS